MEFKDLCKFLVQNRLDGFLTRHAESLFPEFPPVKPVIASEILVKMQKRLDNLLKDCLIAAWLNTEAAIRETANTARAINPDELRGTSHVNASNSLCSIARNLPILLHVDLPLRQRKEAFNHVNNSIGILREVSPTKTLVITLQNEFREKFQTQRAIQKAYEDACLLKPPTNPTVGAIQEFKIKLTELANVLPEQTRKEFLNELDQLLVMAVPDDEALPAVLSQWLKEAWDLSQRAYIQDEWEYEPVWPHEAFLRIFVGQGNTLKLSDDPKAQQWMADHCVDDPDIDLVLQIRTGALAVAISMLRCPRLAASEKISLFKVLFQHDGEGGRTFYSGDPKLAPINSMRENDKYNQTKLKLTEFRNIANVGQKKVDPKRRRSPWIIAVNITRFQKSTLLKLTKKVEKVWAQDEFVPHSRLGLASKAALFAENEKGTFLADEPCHPNKKKIFRHMKTRIAAISRHVVSDITQHPTRLDSYVEVVYSGGEDKNKFRSKTYGVGTTDDCLFGSVYRDSVLNANDANPIVQELTAFLLCRPYRGDREGRQVIFQILEQLRKNFESYREMIWMPIQKINSQEIDMDLFFPVGAQP